MDKADPVIPEQDGDRDDRQRRNNFRSASFNNAEAMHGLFTNREPHTDRWEI